MKHSFTLSSSLTHSYTHTHVQRISPLSTSIAIFYLETLSQSSVQNNAWSLWDRHSNHVCAACECVCVYVRVRVSMSLHVSVLSLETNKRKFEKETKNFLLIQTFSKRNFLPQFLFKKEYHQTHKSTNLTFTFIRFQHLITNFIFYITIFLSPTLTHTHIHTQTRIHTHTHTDTHSHTHIHTHTFGTHSTFPIYLLPL